jgi:hypothetical protein
MLAIRFRAQHLQTAPTEQERVHEGTMVRVQFSRVKLAQAKPAIVRATQTVSLGKRERNLIKLASAIQGILEGMPKQATL